MFLFHGQVFCTDHVEQKKELIQALIRDRQLSKIPKILQVCLILFLNCNFVYCCSKINYGFIQQIN